MYSFSLQALDASFTSLPAQALECSLASTSPASSSGVWTDEARTAFEEITFSSDTLLLFTVGKPEAKQDVMLLADGVDVAWELAAQEHALCQYKAAGRLILNATCAVSNSTVLSSIWFN